MAGEPVTPEIRASVSWLPLDHRPHRAVEEEDA